MAKKLSRPSQHTLEDIFFALNILVDQLERGEAGGSGSSPLTTKGDLYTHSSVDTRLPVGTDGFVLSASSADTTGLKWISPPAGTTPTGTGFRHVTAGVEDAATKLVDTADVNNDQIDNTKLANVSSGTFKGRITAGIGDPEDLNSTQARTILGVATTPTGTGFTHITSSAQDAAAKLVDTADINNDQVTDAKLSNMPPPSFKGRITAGTGDPETLDMTQATSMLNTFTSTLKGLAPSSGGGTTNFLRADGTWAAPGGSGGNPVLSTFTQDLGTASDGGHFDLTGLSGLTAGKLVVAMQTDDPIASKGNATDEPEMDQIQITGHVLSSTSIRFYWNANNQVVGDYNFGYFVAG